MPKVRNEATERSIRSAAWQLFFEKGFSATSYTDLADASGVSRPLVQRYFPKKEILIAECVTAIRTAAVAVCDERYQNDVGPLARLYLRGQVNVATYFACDGVRRIMLDVFSSRELTQQTIAEGFLWTVSQVLPERPEIAAADEPDEMIMAMGGLYEIVYVYLSRGGTPDVAACALPSTELFGRLFGVPEPEGGLSAFAIPPDELAGLAAESVARIDWR